MQIYDALKKDHQAILHIIAQMEHTSDQAVQKRKNLLERLRDELIPHMRAEEKVFYDTLRELDETQSLILEGEEEHNTCEMVLRDLEATDPNDKHWAAKLVVLKDNLEFHLEEEEGEVFSQARELLAPEEATMMGEAFKNLKADVSQGSLLDTALERVAQFMPPRLSRRFTDLGRRLT